MQWFVVNVSDSQMIYWHLHLNGGLKFIFKLDIQSYASVIVRYQTILLTMISFMSKYFNLFKTLNKNILNNNKMYRNFIVITQLISTSWIEKDFNLTDIKYRSNYKDMHDT
jgi:hypothetical protein